MERILSFLHSASWFAFATMEGDHPRVRPFGSAMAWQGRLYVCTGEYKRVYRELRENPQVCVCAVAPSGDRWIRLTGRAVFDPRPEAVEAMYSAEPDLRDIYEKQGLALGVAYIADGVCEFHDMTDEFETVCF